MKKVSVSIVIVNYKNDEDIIGCIKSLLEQDYQYISIIVVDNSEEEKYIENIYKNLKNEVSEIELLHENELQTLKNLNFKKDIALIKSNENKGFSGGNNIGIKLAQKNEADFVWLLNPDTVVNQDTLTHMLNVSEKLNVPVLTCKIKSFYNKNKVQYDGVKVDYAGFQDIQDQLKYPAFLSGANVLLKTQVFERIGLMDEDFFLYFEDNYLFFKLRQEEIPVIYTPHTFIYHKGGVSTNGFLNSVVSNYYYSRNIFLYDQKIGMVQNYLENLSTLKKIVEKKRHNKKLIKAIYLGIYDFIAGVKGKKENLEQTVKNNEIPINPNVSEEINTSFGHVFKKPRDKTAQNLFFNSVEKELETMLTQHL